MNGPDVRKNLQVRQPGIEGYESADKNGWPEPLVDPSDPLKLVVTAGSSGSQNNFQAMATSGQNDLSLTEGRTSPGPGNMIDQGGHGDKLKTSQQNADDHSTPENERSQ